MKMKAYSIILIVVCIGFGYFFVNAKKKPGGNTQPMEGSSQMQLKVSTTKSKEYESRYSNEDLTKKKTDFPKRDSEKEKAKYAPAYFSKQNVSADLDPQLIKKKLLSRGILFGTCLGPEDLYKQPLVDKDVRGTVHLRPSGFLDTVAKYFNLISIPAFFHHLEREGRGKFDFSSTDAVADFAIAHGYKITAHDLVWYNNLPEWLMQGNFSPQELSDILKTHIQTVVRHYKEKYPGMIISWIVVNEGMSDSEGFDPVHSYPNGLRKAPSIWTVIHKAGSTDPSDYIQLAFEWAHEADPTVKLYWNEYNTEYKGFKMDRWFNIVKSLKDKGVPIDGVGFQSHLDVTYNHPTNDLLENMNRFADIGLQSEVTEIDVMLSKTAALHPPYHPVKLDAITPANLAKQAELYRGFLDACIKAKNCNAYVTWQTWDPENWTNSNYKKITGEFEGPFYPGLFDDNMKPKQIYSVLANEVTTQIANP